MTQPLILHPDRLLPADPTTRAIARELLATVADLPIVSPHGHTDPAWFATNLPFANAAELLLVPDHYVFRMLHSQGISLADLGVGDSAVEPRAAWQLLARNFHLFRGTPTRIWLDWVFAEVFGLDVVLADGTADFYFETIEAKLATPELRPRAVLDRYNIEVIATTEGPLDDLAQHRAIRAANASGEWAGRVVTTYRPDAVTDPDQPDFLANLERFGAIAGEDIGTWRGYLEAHRARRANFAELGATATDHGHPTAATADLPEADAAALYGRILAGRADGEDAETFRAQLLTEMARMSVDDGLVMQIHPGSSRNHDPRVFARYGRDKGADIPTATEYVRALKPMLDAVGGEPGLSIILFTLDETTYARELAPLAGHYPSLRLGPAWWFHDSPEGMRRFRRQTTETAGFYNTVGFNDDTRALLSIPARHDVARRIDCGFLAELVVEHRIADWEAAELAGVLAYDLAKAAYRL